MNYNLEVSSAEDGKGRWTEIELTRFEDGTFELTITGCSDEVGEWDLSKTRECASADEVLSALRAPNGGMSRLARQLLATAAVTDEDIRNLPKEEEHVDRDRGSRRGRQDNAG